MSLMRENDPRFANLERRVGLFLIACVVAVAAVILAAGARQGLFTPKATITFVDESGRDLAAGMEVVTRGFRVGSVSRVRLNEEGKVEVALEIDRDYLRWIRRDSTARMLPKVIGGGRIEISPGSPGEPQIRDGDAISFQRDAEIMDVAKKILEEVRPVLLSVRSLLEYLDDPRGDVKTAIGSVAELTAGLAETSATVDRTVTDLAARFTSLTASLERLTARLEGSLLPKVESVVERGDGVLAAATGTATALDGLVREDLAGILGTLRGELLPQVRELVESAGAGVAGANRAVATVDGKLPALLERVETTLAGMEQITGNLVPVSRQAGGMVKQGQALMDDSGVLLRRTQELWPFRGGEPARERKVDVDSYRTPPGIPGGNDPGAPGSR